MAKIIAWLILIFLVLLALRVIARRNAGRRGSPAQSAAQPMVRCARCGVFLPRTEAKEIDGGYVCAAEGCVPHG